MIIYKYKLELTEEQEIKMEEGAIILCCKLQYGKPTLWVKADYFHKIYRTFRFIATGQPVSNFNKLEYIDTILLDKDNLVFHLFEVLE